MKARLIALAAILLVISMTGCTLNFERQPTPFPTLEGLPSPTALVPLQGTSQSPPAATAILPVTTPVGGGQNTDFSATAVIGGIVPGAPSGPYAVVGIPAGDSLNIRSGPGVTYPAVGTLPSNASNIMRTGPSSSVDGALWVEVQNPAGGTGWVHSGYLTEYVAPANFCADARPGALILSFADALRTSNGNTLAALVSPASGWSVRLWRNGNTVVFHRQDAQWVFTSTYGHHWGAAPGSGQDTVGSVHSVVFPKLLEVFNTPGYVLGCDAVQAGGASYDTSWPAQYANINYYSVYKPGPVGNEMSWRTVLIGFEYVQGTPYLYSTTQMGWEP